MAIKSKEINRAFIYCFVLTLGLGSMNFGYANGVFNSFFVDFEFIYGIETYDDRKFWSSFITGICSTGAAIGAFTIASFIKWGKRNCIFLTNAIMIVGCSMT